jgi:cell wall-associated NlpC family hydrolase
MQFLSRHAPTHALTHALARVGLATACLAATVSFNVAAAQNQNNYGNEQLSTQSARPSTTQDDMGSFLADRGIVSIIGDQVSQAGRIVTSRASDLVVNAMGFLGVPYKRGGNSAESGFDCSGFVKAMYEQTIGHVLPRRAAEQANATMPIDKSEMQPGDLVFFNTLRSTFSHVGIYVGDNKFIHSPRSGSVVRVEDMRINYWSSRFDGARRVLPTEVAKKP